jgi:phosphoesterase RecJ-like protein
MSQATRATARPAAAERAAALALAADRLHAAGRIWLGTHREPDGDAIGSLLGLGWLLEGAGKAVTLACQDPAPAELRDLPGADRIRARGPAGHDLAVALDAGDLGRLGRLTDPAGWAALPSVVLDHHASNTGFGTVNVIDPAAASTAELVLALADALGLAPDATAATCLLSGVVSDTIGFRTPNTGAATLEAASRLVASGADLAAINQALFFRRPLAALRLAARALERLEVRGRIGLAALAQADYLALGATPGDGRGISSYLATAAELDAVAVLAEQPDGAVDVSLRSRPGVDVGRVAAALGGGGHAAAAGARLAPGLEGAVAAAWAALEGLIEAGP